MTLAEHREKCIKAMSIAWLRARGYKTPETMVPDWMMRQTIEEQTITFDSLHGLARVNPIEATEDDIDRVAQALSRRKANEAWKKIPDGYWQTQARVAIVAMFAAGDLTNPPERKP